MDNFWQFAASYWWLIFVFGGAIAAGAKAIAQGTARYAERRQDIQLEKYRIKHGAEQAKLQTESDAETSRAAFIEATRRLLAEHDAVDDRWLSYELDPVKVLEYPLLTDMREPTTVNFHQARRLADSLRPSAAEDIVEPAAQREYREAVHAYATALDVAEAEAKRVRQSGFGIDERNRLATAMRLLNLALDDAASPQERQQAYQRVRSEIDGLIAMPESADVRVREQIADALPPGTSEP